MKNVQNQILNFKVAFPKLNIWLGNNIQRKNWSVSKVCHPRCVVKLMVGRVITVNNATRSF